MRRSFQKGFTLVEVLVTLIVAMIFVSVTLQMFVSAAFFRAKGEQYDQAYNWIQEDYEMVFTEATQYQANVLPASSMCAATTPNNGLAAGFVNDPTVGLGGTTITLGPRTFGGQSFMLTRTANYATSDDPYKLVALTYTVTPTNGGVAIANSDSEVMIYAGLKCP